MPRKSSSIGVIRRYAYNRKKFVAEINHRHRRYRSICESRDAAAKWINATLLSLDQETPPLTQADMIAASNAKAELPDGITLSNVVEYWIRHHKTNGHHTVEELAKEFLADKQKAGLRPASLRNLRWHCKRLCECMGATSAAAVERSDIEKAFAHHAMSNFARNEARRAWKNLFGWAIRAGMCQTNPLQAITNAIVDETTPGILTVQQANDLLYAAKTGPAPRRRMLPIIAMALFSGIRTTELSRLTWQDVNFDAGHILIGGAAAKTRNRRYATINPTLRPWLERYRRARGLIIRVKERARIIRMKRIKAAAGLRAPHNALRHSFASYHLAMWQDASKTAFELGHARPDMLYRHYRNLVTKEAAEAYWALTPDKITRPRRTTAKKSAS